MKLQINLKGSWRDVVSFDVAQLDTVKFHARELLKIVAGQTSMRIANDSNVALERLNGPDFTWKKAGQA